MTTRPQMVKSAYKYTPWEPDEEVVGFQFATPGLYMVRVQGFHSLPFDVPLKLTIDTEEHEIIIPQGLAIKGPWDFKYYTIEEGQTIALSLTTTTEELMQGKSLWAWLGIGQ